MHNVHTTYILVNIGLSGAFSAMVGTDLPDAGLKPDELVTIVHCHILKLLYAVDIGSIQLIVFPTNDNKVNEYHHIIQMRCFIRLK